MTTERAPKASRSEIALLAGLAVWALFPLLLLLLRAAQLDRRFTGADGLIGADGVLGADQLQYLAWARDASAHSGLASDLFTFAPSGHVYLEPLFAITGLLLRLGASLPLAYELWKPVGIIVLFLAALAWARRMFGDQRAPRAAAVALSLFLFTPLVALFTWAGLGSEPLRFQLYLIGDELLMAGKLWGYVPAAIGTALVPIALLALERAIDPDLGSAPAQRELRRGAEPRPLALATVASLLASWLHPWQGITLLIIFLGLAVAQKMRPWLSLLAPAIAAALPLGYYYLLSHHDPAWQLAGHYEVIPRPGAAAMLLALGPLALLSALGVRRPRGVVAEQALLLWAVACLITYWVNDSFAVHALQGLTFPVAVLAVRGWRRLPAPAVLGAVALVLVTIPGLVYDGRKFIRTADSKVIQYYLPNSDAAALDWVTAHAPPGGVLAPTPFAVIIPSQTGRNVWVGHGYWSRDYPGRAREVDRLFGGKMHRAEARSFIASTTARILVEDCGHRFDLSRELRGELAAVHRFGCARVYLLRSASR